jgi:hypothetical protein
VAFDVSAVTDAPQADDGDVLETVDENALHDDHGQLARPLSRGDGSLTPVSPAGRGGAVPQVPQWRRRLTSDHYARGARPGSSATRIDRPFTP